MLLFKAATMGRVAELRERLRLRSATATCPTAPAVVLRSTAGAPAGHVDAEDLELEALLLLVALGLGGG
eukprot:3585589-Alexandrium_andersonii.AAC.1